MPEEDTVLVVPYSKIDPRDGLSKTPMCHPCLDKIGPRLAEHFKKKPKLNSTCGVCGQPHHSEVD